jgi:hypothetical protein
MAIRELKVRITGDNSGLQRSLKDSQKKISGFSNVLKGAVAGMAAAFSFAVVIRGLGNVTKAASDAQETFSKFDTVFRDVSKAAEKEFKTLRDEYGLSSVASKQLLSDTGDLLTGFGFSGKAALDLSGRVNRLAVDLASFTNFSGGAAGASKALTKALLGERESVKALGISILEEDVKKQVAINTAKGLIFETERQAKAYATLDIAIQQSKNSIGGYERESDSFANQTKLLKERLNDLAVVIGTALLPAGGKLVSFFIELTEKATKFFDDVTTETNFTKLEKLGRLLGGAFLGILTGGRAGRGLTDPLFDAAWEQQAEDLLTPLDKVNRELISVFERWKRLDDLVKAGNIGVADREDQEWYLKNNQRVIDLFRERKRLQDEQAEAERQTSEAARIAAEQAAAEARKMEEQRRAALGEIGRLMEDIEKAEAAYIAANSQARREAYAQEIVDLTAKLELLSQEATMQNKINEFLKARSGLTIGIPGVSEGPQMMPSLPGTVGVATPGINETFSETTRQLNEMAAAQTIAAEAAKKHADMMEALRQIAEDAAFSIGEAFGMMAAKGGQATGALIAQAIAQAVAMMIRQIAATLPFPASIAAIAGVGMFQGIMKSQIPAYRDGALAYGPSLGMIGEYANASTNPEVIAPLDKLQSMMGGGTGEVEFRIKGQELWGVLKKYENRLNQNS